MNTWWLQARGRLPWVRVRAELAGYTCAWVDRYGLRVGEPPAEPPVSTHLWGWSEGRYVRVRVNGNDAYVGVLHETQPAEGVVEPVSVQERHAVMRGGPDSANAEPDDADGPARFAVELLEVPGPGPITFIRPSRDE
ncbi:MAG TPA: hypothetical protein VIR27_12170 [Mycobacteriales bacterium]